MKKMILTLTLLILGGNSIKSATLIEHVIPQYFGSKSSWAVNNCRTPFAVCLQITGLNPNQPYSLVIGVALVSEPSGVSGAGNVWNGTNFSGQTISPAFTTDATGDSKPFWCFIQPTGNAARFEAGQVHNLRISLSGAYFITTKTLTALDISVIERTVTTADDGAFFRANNLCLSGKYCLIFNNTAGTGNPMSAYQIRNCIATNPPQSELPISVSEFFNQSSASDIGDFAGTIPTSINNPNGVRRIEIRNSDNSIYKVRVDADGIWPDLTNTTILLRRNVVKARISFCSIVNVVLSARYLGNISSNRNGLRADSGSSGMVPDTAILHLRQASPPYAIVESSAALLDSSGSGAFIFSDVTDSANYYLSVTHRNSIETWSAVGINFSNATMNYNFSSALNQAYGNNLIQVDDNPNLFGIYSGDVNQDGAVDLTDGSLIDNDAGNFISGYVNTDLNGDDFVDLADLSIADNNAFNYVNVVRP